MNNLSTKDTQAKTDNPRRYKLEVSAPGFKKNDFRITADNGMLKIR